MVRNVCQNTKNEIILLNLLHGYCIFEILDVILHTLFNVNKDNREYDTANKKIHQKGKS